MGMQPDHVPGSAKSVEAVAVPVRDPPGVTMALGDLWVHPEEPIEPRGLPSYRGQVDAKQMQPVGQELEPPPGLGPKRNLEVVWLDVNT
jgi:hypothetical protein